MDIRIVKRLRKAKDQLGKSLSDISAEVGLSKSYLSGIFWGKATPNMEFFIQFARKYRVNANWLLIGDGDMFLDGAGGAAAKEEYNAEREIVKDILVELLTDDELFKQALLKHKVK
jgi:transcriptional regulator with XRE-family HTH domain